MKDIVKIIKKMK